jgi:hypothetical protein
MTRPAESSWIEKLQVLGFEFHQLSILFNGESHVQLA